MSNKLINETWRKAAIKAVDEAEAGLSCSEAMLSAFGPLLGLDRNQAILLGSGLGGGLGLTGEVCGAITGACLILGLRHGTSDPEDNFARQNVYLQVQEFLTNMEQRLGALYCRDLCMEAHQPLEVWAATLRQSGKPARIVAQSAETLSELLTREE